MVCMKCGREVRDDAAICKGCGAQQYHAQPVEREKIKNLMPMKVKVGDSEMTIWQVCVVLACAVVLLALSVAVIPMLSEAISDISSSEHHTGILSENPSEVLIDEVSGEILVLNANIADCVVDSEEAYKDGSWNKTLLVNGTIKVKILRRASSDDWVNSHIFPLYPDVQQVVPIDAAPSLSDCTSTRIRINNTTYAPGCVVEVVIIKTASYDHLFIVEMPEDLFEDYETWIGEWVEGLEVVDAAEYDDGQRAEV